MIDIAQGARDARSRILSVKALAMRWSSELVMQLEQSATRFQTGPMLPESIRGQQHHFAPINGQH